MHAVQYYEMHASHPFRIFAVSGFLTIAIGVLMLYVGGFSLLWLYAILVLLEVTFSFDNAVINSKILMRLSPLWQTLFLTVGIFFAVFVVRFLFPILIVMLATGLPGDKVVDLALNDPDEYAHHVENAGPMIEAFGGTFLLMIGVYYFVDRQKDVHWLSRIESGLSKVARIRFIKLASMLVLAGVLFFTVEHDVRQAVLISSLLGIALHVGLESLSSFFEKRNDNSESPGSSSVSHMDAEQDASEAHSRAYKKYGDASTGAGNTALRHKSSAQAAELSGRTTMRQAGRQQVGWAAFASFMYLQVLDASFSLDGVIGAFAITDMVLLIMAGLGAGALWVRSLTVYLVRNGTLAKYRYLSHGAHWAILALGLVMIAKLYHVEMPEYVTGSLGLIFITTAVVSSIIEKRRLKVQ